MNIRYRKLGNIEEYKAGEKNALNTPPLRYKPT